MSTTTAPDPAATAAPVPRPAGSAHTPRLPAAVRMLLTLVAFMACAYAMVPVLMVPGVGDAMSERTPLGILIAILVCGVSLSAYLLASGVLVRGVDRRPFADLGLRLDGRAGIALLAGVGISCGVMLAAGALELLTGWGRDVAMPPNEPIPLWMATALVLMQAFVLQGIGEEVLCRGYLMQSLRSRPVLAVLGAAVVFTLPHLLSRGGQQNLGEHLAYLAIPFGFALTAGVLGVALRSVWAAVGIHGGLHVANTLVSELGLSVDGVAQWLLLGGLYTLVAVLIGLRIPRARWDEVRDRGPYARATA